MADFEEGANILQTQELERQREGNQYGDGTSENISYSTHKVPLFVSMQTEGIGSLAAGEIPVPG